jgi:hypothetical protein
VAATVPPPPGTIRSHRSSSLCPEWASADEEAEVWLEQWSIQLGQLTRPILAGSISAWS